MKKLIGITFLCVMTLTAMAQHETVFGRARVVGGFGGPLFEWGLGNDLNTSIGGGGGIVIDNVFIGAYGMGSVDFEKLFQDDDIEQLDLGHGGFWLGVSWPTYKLVHLYGSARIGWGAVNVDLKDPNLEYRDVDKVFVMTPEIGVEINLTRWFRASGAVGYRYLSGANETRGYTDDDFRGALANLTLRFGWFGNRRN